MQNSVVLPHSVVVGTQIMSSTRPRLGESPSFVASVPAFPGFQAFCSVVSNRFPFSPFGFLLRYLVCRLLSHTSQMLTWVCFHPSRRMKSIPRPPLGCPLVATLTHSPSAPTHRPTRGWTWSTLRGPITRTIPWKTARPWMSRLSLDQT